jgi:hypothetical protein
VFFVSFAKMIALVVPRRAACATMNAFNWFEPIVLTEREYFANEEWR